MGKLDKMFDIYDKMDRLEKKLVNKLLGTMAFGLFLVVVILILT